ncbi:MAG TPA: hypothetical protein VHM90_12305 [Phycisphaerae bacterium]|nr:hypothetical protein [Phycisphaerae bacterium]
MNALKNIFFLALCLLIGLGLGKGFVAWKNHGGGGKGFTKQEEPILITGVGDAPRQRGFTIQPGNLAALPAVLKENEEIFGTSIGLEYSSAVGKQALTDAVQAAHRKHMGFVLLPPAVFNPRNPFHKPLRDVAEDAQRAGVDVLCISWLNSEPDEAYWKQQAAEARQAFEGQLILAATPEIMPWIGCWDAVDIVGAIGPVPIAHRAARSDAALEMKDFRVSWDSAITSLESLAKVNTRPLALLHMNMPANGNLQTQKLAYEALLVETKGRAKITDILLFNWEGPDAPNKFPDVRARMTDAWDPKKPRLPDVAASEPVENGDDGAGDGGDGAATAATGL